MAAIVTQIPEFNIGSARAEILAKALADVSRHYNMATDGPTMSLVKLALAAGIVNVPILFAVANRRREAMAQRQRPASASTADEFDFNQAPKTGTYTFQ